MGQPFVSTEHPHPQRHDNAFYCFQTNNFWNNNNPTTIDLQALFLVKTLAILYIKTTVVSVCLSVRAMIGKFFQALPVTVITQLTGGG